VSGGLRARIIGFLGGLQSRSRRREPVRDVHPQVEIATQVVGKLPGPRTPAPARGVFDGRDQVGGLRVEPGQRGDRVVEGRCQRFLGYRAAVVLKN
jgi:hypothetical protein